MWYSGAIAKCVTHNTGVVSSNPARVTMKTPLARKTTGNHLIKPTALEKIQSPVSGLCYGRNQTHQTINILEKLNGMEKVCNVLTMPIRRATLNRYHCKMKCVREPLRSPFANSKPLLHVYVN